MMLPASTLMSAHDSCAPARREENHPHAAARILTTVFSSFTIASNAMTSGPPTSTNATRERPAKRLLQRLRHLRVAGEVTATYDFSLRTCNERER